MACDTPIGLPVTVRVDSASGVWIDSGLTVNAGECLQITAPGTTIVYGLTAGQCAYPEGVYSASGNPCGPQTYDPTAVLTTYVGDPGLTSYQTLEQPPYCLVAKIAGVQPTGTHLTGTLRPNRSAVFNAATVGAGGKVWFIFNDGVGFFGDNVGVWNVTLQRLTTIAGTMATVVVTGGRVEYSDMTSQVYEGLTVAFPNGYQVGVDLSSVPGLFSTTLTSVRVRGPYRAYLAGTILHVCNDAGELALGTALDGVDILRIGT